MPTDLYGAAGASNGTFFYAAGGYSFSSGMTLAVFNRFDPVANSWTAMASMPQAAKDAVRSRIPLGRFGEADEVARLVRFLCTEGDWITGAQLNINGGQYM